MAGDTDPIGKDIEPDPSEKPRKQWQLNALILAGVFLLSVVLPPEYKAYAPLLFVIPFIINVANKIRQSGENPADPSGSTAYTPQMPGYRMPPREPYSYTPKDPKDPRKYKPIG